MASNVKIAAKADVVSLTNLSKLVDKAVADATARTGVKPLDSHIVLKWELMGRRVKDLITAEAFADSVAKSLSAAGHKVKPGVIMFDKKRILAGFFPVDVLKKDMVF